MGKLTLRGFRTVHGEQLLAQICGSNVPRTQFSQVHQSLSVRRVQTGKKARDSRRHQCHAGREDSAHTGAGKYLRLLPVRVTRILSFLSEPERTIVLTAALTGLRKGEIRRLCWADFDGQTLSVRRSIWNRVENAPKTNRSKAPIPVVKQLAEALEKHKLRMGKLAQPSLPIFQAGNGKPLNLDNLVRHEIGPALTRCAVCAKREDEHAKADHEFKLDKSIPSGHGWHAFRRGLATNLHTLGVDDKTIQAILRHSNVSLTINVYIKSVKESQVSAMDVLEAKFSKTSNNLPTGSQRLVNRGTAKGCVRMACSLRAEVAQW